MFECPGEYMGSRFRIFITLLCRYSTLIMTHTYLIQLLKTLSAEEKKEVLLFTASPFFNRGKLSEDAHRLLQIILNEAGQHPEWDFDKVRLYQQLLPGEPYIEGKLEKIMADLNKMIRTFLTVNLYLDDTNQFQQTLDLAQILRKRGLESRYHTQLKKLNDIRSATIASTTDLQYKQFLLEHEYYDWESLNNRKKGDLNIPEVIKRLDLYYYTYRLELLNHLLLQFRVTKVEEMTPFGYLAQEPAIPSRYLDAAPLLLITEKIHRLLTAADPKVSDFFILANLLSQHENRIGPETLQRIYTFFRSLCAHFINSGYDDLLPVLHRINCKNIEKGYLYYEGKISSGAIANVTNVALLVGEAEWARDFIESHKDSVIGDNETLDFYRLNLASYYFFVKNFDAALDLIPSGSQDTEYHYRGRRLRLKLYYETNSELLHYEIDAFKMLVSRASKKVLATHFRDLQNNFINLLFQIVHSRPGDPQRVERLVRRIQSKKSVAEKKWLLEKAEQLA